jgi:hypothetical protein
VPELTSELQQMAGDSAATPGLALTSSAPGHATGTIQTAAFTLVSHADGTATLTKVTTGSFCSSDPAPAGVAQVISAPKTQPGQAPTVVINPAAMPAGTELSVGNFQLANSGRTYLTLIDKSSYACASTPPAAASRSVDMRRWACQLFLNEITRSEPTNAVTTSGPCPVTASRSKSAHPASRSTCAARRSSATAPGSVEERGGFSFVREGYG